jgi:hypothetical protein
MCLSSESSNRAHARDVPVFYVPVFCIACRARDVSVF